MGQVNWLQLVQPHHARVVELGRDGAVLPVRRDAIVGVLLRITFLFLFLLVVERRRRRLGEGWHRSRHDG
jgi:hypothetical protein